MRIWVYGNSLKQVRDIIENIVDPGDIVVGTSVRTEVGSEFPRGGLTPAISAAIRGEIDLLLISTFELLECGAAMKEMTELFQNYGVSIKSASNCGINNS